MASVAARRLATRPPIGQSSANQQPSCGFSQPVGILAIFKHKLYEKYVKSSKPTKNVYSCILGKHKLGFKCRGTCDGQLFNCVTEKKKK